MTRSPEHASGAREEVLRRVREAVGVGSSPAVPTPRAYRTVGELAPGSAPLVDLLVERIEDYGATVRRCDGREHEVAATVRSVLDALGARSVVCPPAAEVLVGSPRVGAQRPDPGVEGPGPVTVLLDDGGLDVDALDAVDAVVTGSAVAIAETGTLVLDGASRCGRRVITLVPDVHVCVVRVDQVVQTVPEALARLDPTRPLTFISGPSATSDIELSRVEGVHGPRTLVVVLAGPET